MVTRSVTVNAANAVSRAGSSSSALPVEPGSGSPTESAPESFILMLNPGAADHERRWRAEKGTPPKLRFVDVIPI